MLSQLWRRLTGAREPSASAAASPAASATASAAPAPEVVVAPPVTAPQAATEASLHRSLNWRSKVLLEGASREAKASDGPELVEALRTASDSVIRQPPVAAQQALNALVLPIINSIMVGPSAPLQFAAQWLAAWKAAGN